MGGVIWIALRANGGLARVPAAPGAGAPAPGRGRSTQVTLEYAEGAVGVLLYSWEAHTRLGGVRLSRIHGTQGAIAFESNGALVVHHGRAHGAWSPRPSEASGSAPMLRDFVGALRSGRPAAFTLAHARRDVALIEAAKGSTSPRRTE